MTLPDFFRSREVEGSRALRAVACVLTFYFFMTWSQWFPEARLQMEGVHLAEYLPTPPMAGAEWIIGSLSRPLSRLIMRALATLALVQLYWFQSRGGCRKAMDALALQFVCKLIFYSNDYCQVANFHHVHLYFTFFFLLAADKMFFQRLCLAMVYWMAGIVKLTPSWMRGEYFNSVPARLPLWFHHPVAIKAACISVIILELLGPFFFFSPKILHRRVAAFLFLAFHLYSGCIVGLWYTALMIPYLCAIFQDGFTRSLVEDAPQGRAGWRDYLGGLTLAAMLGTGTISLLIGGDVRLTGEGRAVALFMFDANHRTRVVLSVRDQEDHDWQFRLNWPWPDENFSAPCHMQIVKDGRPQPVRATAVDGAYIFNPALFRAFSVRIQNDPYCYYFWALRCQRLIHPKRIGIEIWSQLDGHEEEHKTVNVTDFAKEVEGYSLWHHNSWINP